MSIAEMSQNETAVRIRWADGAGESFDYLWLRDNCSCQGCGDKSGGHRYLELGDIPLDVAPKQVVINSAGAVEIVWAPDKHRSVYPADWLRQNSHVLRHERTATNQKVLWNGALGADLPSHRYSDVQANSRHRLALFEDIHRYGFCLLREVPVVTDEVERIAALVGYIRETHYGRVFDLYATPEQRILAQTAHAIRPHNDELFRDPTPGIMVMHCLIASEDGRGESTLVDGFNAAKLLAAEDPDAFDLLTRVPMTHARRLSDGVDNVALQATWRTITLNDDGYVSAVRVNERTMAPLELPNDSVRPAYAALRKLLRLLYDPQAAIQFRMEPGDAMIFDNHRVLHARLAFTGKRHIRQCHVDRDEFFSRLRVLRDSAGIGSAH